MKTDGFSPLFWSVATDIKAAMEKGGGNSYLTCAALFGLAWSNEVGGIFAPNKKAIYEQTGITQDTQRKYLGVLCELGYLTQINDAAYKISKSVQFGFTISTTKPELSTADMLGPGFKAEHVGSGPSMSTQMTEHVDSEPPITNYSSNNNNDTSLNLVKQAKTIWLEAGLNPNYAIFNRARQNLGDTLLVKISSEWLEWILNGGEMDTPLIAWKIERGESPPAEKQTLPSTWFSPEELKLFAVRA